MFGTLFYNPDDCTLCIFNVLSGIHIYTHPVKGPISGNIWISGECLQFATMGTRSVTTWEVGFAETNLPVEVETHSIPDIFHSPDVFLLHPTLCSLALIKGKSVCVWSTQDSKFLLDPINLDHNQEMSFSPDGHFFVCGKQTLGGKGLEILLWKESHTGYVPYQSLTSNLNVSKPLISPDRGSIIAFNCEAIQLWHTMDSSTPCTILAQGFQRNQNPNHFIVEFSPGQMLAAVTQVEDEMVTVLDLQSGVPRLIINAGMRVYGLGINGSSIVAISNGKIVTWNLLTESHITGLRMDITNSAWTTTFNHGQFNNRGIPTALMSPNLYCFVIKDRDVDTSTSPNSLYLCDIPTGKHLGSVPVEYDCTPWFAQNGYEVWFWKDDGIDRWKIVEGSEPSITKLENLGLTIDEPVSPWHFSYGYKILDGQWIFNYSGKQLLWLPPPWRSYQSGWTLGELWQ